MSDTLSPEHTGPALRAKWVTAYTDFLVSVVGLRHLLLAGHPTGLAQPIFADKARGLLELADELNALGRCPAFRFAGDEERLWQATAAYAAAACWETLARVSPLPELVRAVEECRAAWVQFQTRILALPDDFERHLPTLDATSFTPRRLAGLFSDGRRTAP